MRKFLKNTKAYSTGCYMCSLFEGVDIRVGRKGGGRVVKAFACARAQCIVSILVRVVGRPMRKCGDYEIRGNVRQNLLVPERVRCYWAVKKGVGIIC